MRNFHYDRAGKKKKKLHYFDIQLNIFMVSYSKKCFIDCINLKIRGATQVGNDFKAAESFAN
jgi:hypothetical protein